MLEVIDTYLHISDLIFRQISGMDLSLQEEEQINEWLQQSEKNKLTYENLLNSSGLQSYSDVYNKIDKDAAWKLVNKQLKPLNINLFYNRILKYASIIIILLMIGGGFYYYQNRNISIKEDNFATIIPGGNKAVLYTSGGSVIELENRDSIISNSGLTVINSQQTLSYQEDANSNKHEATIQYDRLVTPRGGEYEVVLSDGTHVWINADSELKYPVRFAGNERIVFLEGEAYFDVKTDPNHPFIVKTKNMDVCATGTSFNVMAYRDENVTQATLVQGKVNVEVKLPGKNPKKFNLNPGMQVEYLQGAVSGTAYAVDVNTFIGWKNGVFIFKNERLDNIFRIAARWYDVEFEYEDPQLKEILFTGQMRKFDSFKKLIEVFQETTDVEFRMKERRILVSKRE